MTPVLINILYLIIRNSLPIRSDTPEDNNSVNVTPWDNLRIMAQSTYRL